MMSARFALPALIAATGVVANAQVGGAQGPLSSGRVAFDSSAPLPRLAPLPRDRELELARLAAPEALSASATVWVVGARGYEIASRGSNGWGCFVQRDYTGRQLFPRCDDPARVSANYPVYFLLEETRVTGGSARDYERAVGEGYRLGRFHTPPPGALAYMYADSPMPRIAPHVMISRPYCDAQTYMGAGTAAAGDSAFGLTILGRGLPNCDLIIFTPPETRRTAARGSR